MQSAKVILCYDPGDTFRGFNRIALREGRDSSVWSSVDAMFLRRAIVWWEEVGYRSVLAFRYILVRDRLGRQRELRDSSGALHTRQFSCIKGRPVLSNETRSNSAPRTSAAHTRQRQAQHSRQQERCLPSWQSSSESPSCSYLRCLPSLHATDESYVTNDYWILCTSSTINVVVV